MLQRKKESMNLLKVFSQMNKLFLTLPILFFTVNLFGQDTLHLENAVSITLDNNYSILVARNELKIDEVNTSIGAAGFLPRIDADAGFLKSRINSNQEYFDGRRVERNDAVSENLSAGVSLNWTIFDGLRMFASLDRLKTLRESGRIRLKGEIENGITSVIKNYYDIVRLYLRMEVLERTLAISEERVRIAESKKEVGSGSKFELTQAKVDLNEGQKEPFDVSVRLNESPMSYLNYNHPKNEFQKLYFKENGLPETMQGKDNVIYIEHFRPRKT